MAQRGWSITGKILTIVIVAIVAVALFAALQIANHGVSARDAPTKAEEGIAEVLRHAAIPRSARAMANPVKLDDAALADAREHFADHCALCHGNDGKADTEMGRGLYPKVPDMSDGSPDLSDGELFYIIKNGVRLTGMPAWGDPRDPRGDAESWRLVHFIRHLPKMTPAELEQMKKMNPVSPAEGKQTRDEDEFLSGNDQKKTPSP